MSSVIRRNGDILQQAPPSEWLPNLRGRADVPHVVIDAIERLHEDSQRLYQQLQAKTVEVSTPVPAPPPLNVFTELLIGSPATGGTGAVRLRVGRGSPEGIVEGSAFKDVWLRLDAAGITTFLYVKTSGEGKTGWTAAAL